MNALTGLSAGMLAGGVLIGYMAGSAMVDFGATQEINRLNSEVQNRNKTLETERKSVENHKQFIRKKDDVTRKFCDQYFGGNK